MKQIVKVVLVAVILCCVGFAKSSMEFGKNVYLGDKSFIFDVKNANISNTMVGQVTHKPLIVCDNNFSGFIEYTSPTSLTYYSYKPLKRGIKYSCKINPKYSNKASKTTFYTKSFIVENVEFIKPDMVYLRFSDEVSADEVLKHVTLEKVDKLAKSKLGYTIERDNKRAFLLRTNERANVIVFHRAKGLKSIHNVQSSSDWSTTLDSKVPKYKTYKDTKTLIIYDEPSWGTMSDGKIVLRLFLEESFYANDNLKRFIEVEGVKNFSVSDSKWVSSSVKKRYNLKDKSWNYVDIIGDFEPNKTYKITLLQGFGNRYSRLDKEQSFDVKVGDFGLYVGFEEEKKPYISSVGDIGIKSVNVNDIVVVVDKMLEQNMRYFMNFDNHIPLARVSKEVVNKKITLGGAKNEYVKHKIPLKEMLKGQSKGIYEITLHYGKDKYVSKKVYLSDIGVGAKVFDEGIFVWTSSLKDTTPFVRAKVEVFSQSNILIASGYTNEDGVFKYEEENFLAKEPKSLLVTKNDEQNFLIFDEAIGKANLYNIKKDKSSYRAYVYFQSKLVRVDEKVSALVVLKDKEYKSLKNAPIKVIIKDPTNKIIYNEAFKSDDKGAFRVEASLLGQKTGRYSFEVYFANKKKTTQHFLVEAFLPQKIKNTISLQEKEIKTDSFIEVNASSNYFFGSVAKFLKGSFRLKATSKEYKNSNFKEYSFENELLKKSNNLIYIDTVKNFTLNDKGQASVLLPTTITQSPSSILDGQIELSVLDDGKEVSTYKNVDIYPYKAMVGLKMRSKILDTSTPLKISTVFIDTFTNEKLKAPLDVFIKQKRWYYTYDSNGYYKWDEELDEMEHFSINANSDIEKIFPKSGDYVVEVKDSLGGHSASVSFSVRGWDYASLSPTDDIGKNQVNFEDKLYKKGDIVKLDIKSPIKEGQMIITLEGEKVHWYSVVLFENSRIKVDVPLEVDLDDGLYIHTIATRVSDTPSTITPFRASSSSFLAPDRTAHKLKPHIASANVVKSNTTTPLRIKAKPSSKVLISVVDDGILQILGQKPPKPFEFFSIKPKDMIADFDIYDLLMNFQTKGKKLNFGSDGINSLRSKKHLSPKTGAKRVKPFVYFSKLLIADENGDVSVDLKVPSSFNGSATIVAIEISDDGIGASSQKLTIKDDIIIKPVLPRYANVGDSWSIPIRVFNTTKEPLKVSFNAKSNELLSITGFDRNASLKPNSSEIFYANIKIKNFGKGTVLLVATTQKESFSHEVELPLIFAYPLSTFNMQGETKTPLTLVVPKEYAKSSNSTFSLSVSGDVFARLRGGVDYLVGYPYGCAEQTSSKILALLHVKNFLNKDNKNEYEAKLKDRKKFIQEGISKLLGLQNQKGSFGYWEASGEVNTFASIYASDVLFSLRQNGFNVPNYLINNAKNSLKVFSNSKEDSFNRVYATYLLATQNEIDISNINQIYDTKIYQTNIPSIYMMAYILQKARMDSEKKAVLNFAFTYNFNRYKEKKREYGEHFYSYPRDIAFALFLHVKHFEKNKASDELLRRVKKEFKNLYSTQDKAFMLRALSEYFKDYKRAENSFVLKGANIDELYEYEANIGGKYDAKDINLIPKKSWVNYNFSVMAYLPKPIKHQAIKKAKKPLLIYREFVDEGGKKVNLKALKVGQKLYSKVSIVADEDIKNIVINEQVPSCFEIINERMNGLKRSNAVKNSENFKPDYVDIRDDRVLSFVSLKADNEVVFFTPLQITTKGECLLPPILSEAMYDERINDYDLEIKSLHVK